MYYNVSIECIAYMSLLSTRAPTNLCLLKFVTSIVLWFGVALKFIPIAVRMQFMRIEFKQAVEVNIIILSEINYSSYFTVFA